MVAFDILLKQTLDSFKLSDDIAAYFRKEFLIQVVVFF